MNVIQLYADTTYELVLFCFLFLFVNFADGVGTMRLNLSEPVAFFTVDFRIATIRRNSMRMC